MLAEQAPDTPGLRLNRSRWRYAAAGFAVGATYMTVALLLGFELRLGGRDVTLLGVIVLELTFGLFGFWIGRGVEARGWERRAATARESQLLRLSDLQARLAQSEKLAVLGQVASAIARLSIARSQISAPCSAISSLLAVTTDLPCWMDFSMISAAVEVPPISSATTWTSGSSTTSCQRDVRLASGKRLSSSGGFSMTDREQTALTCRGKPSLASICAALSARIRSVPRPTFPSPMRPKLMADTDIHYMRRSKNGGSRNGDRTECPGGRLATSITFVS